MRKAPTLGKNDRLIGLYQVHGQRYTQSTSRSDGSLWQGSQQLPTIFVDASSHHEAAEKARDFGPMPHGGNLVTYHRETGSSHSHEIVHNKV